MKRTMIQELAQFLCGAARLAIRRVALARRLSEERRALRDLDPHLRRDVGLSDQEVEKEAARAPWDAPRGRLERRAATLGEGIGEGIGGGIGRLPAPQTRALPVLRAPKAG